MEGKEPGKNLVGTSHSKHGIVSDVHPTEGVAGGRVVTPPSFMSDEERALAAQEEEAQKDPDRFPDDDPEEEYPR